MLGDKWVRWWLFVDCKRGVGKAGSGFLTWLGFKKGDYVDEQEFLMEHAFRHSEEAEEGEEVGVGEEKEESPAPLPEPAPPQTPKRGRDLSYMYSDLVRTLATALTFGLVSPLISFVSAVGLLVRFTSVAFLVKIFTDRADNGEVERRTTDAQGLPFRCTALIVATSMGFFAGAAALGGVSSDTNEEVRQIAIAAVVCGSVIAIQMISIRRQWGAKTCLRTCFGGITKVVINIVSIGRACFEVMMKACTRRCARCKRKTKREEEEGGEWEEPLLPKA